jgi:predicted outer membrane repeat protein
MAETRGAALYLSTWHGVTISGCTFVRNTAEQGGAVYCGRNDWGVVWVDSCLFVMNEALTAGGNIYTKNTSLHLHNSLLVGGLACFGGGVYVSDANLNENPSAITGCTFWSNRATRIGGGLYAVSDSHMDIRSSTFVSNSGPDGAGIAYSGASVALNQCIIAWSLDGAATMRVADMGSMVLSCCDLYGNEGGDWTDQIAPWLARDGNLNVDPLFCNLRAGDFRLLLTSPCYETGPPCGLIGAWGAGCSSECASSEH